MDSRQGVAAGPGITLAPLEPDDREQFTADNQEAFLHGATQGFDMRDDHFEEDGQIIFRGTIERAIGGEHAEAWRIVVGDRAVGGIVLNIDGTARRGELELLFASPDAHSNSRGIGQAAWREVERMRPGVRTWGLVIPYFEKRNIHFHGPPGTGPCFVGFLCCFGCGGGVRVGVAPEETAVLVGWRRRSGSRVLAGMKAEAVLHASRGVDAGVIAGMVERAERTVQEWPADWRGTGTRRDPSAPGSRNSRPSWPGRLEHEARTRRMQPPKEGSAPGRSVDRRRTSQSFSGAPSPTSRTVTPHPTEQNRNTWQTTLAPDLLQRETEAGKIAVVPDNARSHHARALTGLHGPGRLLERITPIHPPPYAPDHNPAGHVRNTARNNTATIQHETPEETLGASASHITGRTFDHDSERLLTPRNQKRSCSMTAIETILFHDSHSSISLTPMQRVMNIYTILAHNRIHKIRIDSKTMKFQL